MEILHDQALASAIRGIVETGDDLRCAVAFWGPDVADRARGRGATVILDVSMGGTSKGALEAFGVKPDGVPVDVGERVRVLDGLHAKIYLCSDRAIVASANASLNALGKGNRRPALREAGALLTKEDDAEGYAQVVAIWEDYRKASRAVEPRDLDRAPRRPLIASARDWSSDSDAPNSILGAVLRRSDAFAGIAFVFGDHDIDDDDRMVGEKAYKLKHGREPSSDGRQLIAMLHRRKHRAEDEALRHERLILTFWFGSRPDLYAYHDLDRVEHGDYATYFGRRNWTSVRKALGMTTTTKSDVWAADRIDGKMLSKLHGRRKGKRYVAMKADTLYDVLERRSA